ncbi:MAG TPA: Ldh family oxidoreductase, partial [Candidatus Methylomirabilis sp.]|nr:Ldh family oxidoreductase [Candidatus Methylomirabilis sp.]
MKRIAADQLHGLIVRACLKMGAQPETADQVATSLARANLCGYDSHGIHRLVQYHEWWKAGLLDPTGHPRVTEETAFAAKVDGGQTFGPVVGAFATQMAIKKAQDSGIGIITVRRSTQVGRLADYVDAIQQAGQIGLVAVNDCGG